MPPLAFLLQPALRQTMTGDTIVIPTLITLPLSENPLSGASGLLWLGLNLPNDRPVLPLSTYYLTYAIAGIVLRGEQPHQAAVPTRYTLSTKPLRSATLHPSYNTCRVPTRILHSHRDLDSRLPSLISLCISVLE